MSHDYTYSVYDASGTLHSTIPFRGGYWNGYYKQYYSNGQVEKIYQFDQGQNQWGNAEYFNEDGSSAILLHTTDSLLVYDTLQFISSGDTMYQELKNHQYHGNIIARKSNGSQFQRVYYNDSILSITYTDTMGIAFILNCQDSMKVTVIESTDTTWGISPEYLSSIEKKCIPARNINEVDRRTNTYKDQWNTVFKKFMNRYRKKPMQQGRANEDLYFKLIDAEILIEIVIQPNGSVSRAHPIIDQSENPIFVKSLVDGIMKWKFKPIEGDEYVFSKLFTFDLIAIYKQNSISFY